jgi:hypothetical protein
MRDYLSRKFEMHVEISVTKTDRQGNREPRHIRFYLIDRWVTVPGHIVQVQQERKDAPTLYTHTIFGLPEDRPVYADEDMAMFAAVKEYIRRGVGYQGEET